LILKSTPANKTNESEAKNKDAFCHKKESYLYILYHYQKNKKPDVTKSQKEKQSTNACDAQSTLP